MIPGPIHTIDIAALNALIDANVPESKTLEYKSEIPAKGLDRTAIAFANTAGGDVVLGVDEDGGFPTGLPGITLHDLDQEIRALDQRCRLSAEPPLPRIDFQPIEIAPQRYVLVMRVPQSWTAPHREKKSNRFYIRHAASSEPMDITEVRTAFARLEAAADRVRDFRVDRIARMQGDRTPIRLTPGGRMLLHVLPLTAFTTHTAIDIHALQEIANRLPPMGYAGHEFRLNLDGFLTFSPWHAEGSTAYTQLFRTGALEAVLVLIEDCNHVRLPVPDFEDDVTKLLCDYLKVASNVGIDGPYSVFLSFTNVKGARLEPPSRRARLTEEERHTVQEESLLLPEIVIDERDAATEDTLEPLFETVWNCFGLNRRPAATTDSRAGGSAERRERSRSSPSRC